MRKKLKGSRPHFEVFKNISSLLTLAGVAQKDGRRVCEADLSIISKAAMVASEGRILWLGPQKNLRKEFARKSLEHDLQGRTVLPAFTECHTHAIFAGSRANDFELRNQGVDYQEIARRGGGILQTMRHTRQAKAGELIKSGQQRVDRFLEQGVTTLEIKSSYALDFSQEIKCLQAIKKLQGPRVISTYLGAHALPPEFSSADEYLQYSLQKVLPEILRKKLAQRVDIFVENGFFSAAQALTYLQAAKKMGFALTVHADQLTLSGGSDVACQLQALSADHLIQVSEAEIAKLAKSKLSCVLLPAADLYMKCAFPPARKLIEAGARVVLATDFNPGTSPTQDLSLVGVLARLEMKMSLPEVISAYTFSAAAALGLEDQLGSLQLGKYADFLSFDKDWTDLFYSVGEKMPTKVFKMGREIS